MPLAQAADLYSHYGSRGICLMTILQSWSQGVEVWGREGMSKLWSAATVKVYGGGVSEVEFLENVSKLIGDFDLLSRTVSFGGRQGRSTSRSTRREKILDVAELGALPTGRIVVMASGARPTLAKPTPYWERPTPRDQGLGEAHDPSRDEHRFDDPNPDAGRAGAVMDDENVEFAAIPGLHHHPATRRRRSTSTSWMTATPTSMSVRPTRTEPEIDDETGASRTGWPLARRSGEGCGRLSRGLGGWRCSRRLRSGLRSGC